MKINDYKNGNKSATQNIQIIKFDLAVFLMLLLFVIHGGFWDGTAPAAVCVFRDFSMPFESMLFADAPPLLLLLMLLPPLLLLLLVPGRITAGAFLKLMVFLNLNIILIVAAQL